MPRLDAASISMRSSADPDIISTHDSHLLHGSAESRDRPVQFRDLASSRAAEVLPVPREPLKRYAWATRPEMIAPWSAREAASCPTRSPNVCERYLRERDWYSGIQFKWPRTTASIEDPQHAPRFAAQARMAAAPPGARLTAASFRT